VEKKEKEKVSRPKHHTFCSGTRKYLNHPECTQYTQCKQKNN